MFRLTVIITGTGIGADSSQAHAQAAHECTRLASAAHGSRYDFISASHTVTVYDSLEDVPEPLLRGASQGYGVIRKSSPVRGEVSAAAGFVPAAASRRADSPR